MFVDLKSAGFLVSVFVVLHGNFVLSQESCDPTLCTNHTLCIYPNPGPGPKCVDYVSSPLTAEEKASLVNKQNDYRQKVAQGGEPRGNPGPQPPASNMRQLEWDDELAYIAQRWADQCTDGHDTCKDVARFRVGQNIWTQMSTSPAALNGPIADAVDSWIDEVSKFNKDNMSPFHFDYSCAHYTQLVWADTSLVGCAEARFQKDGYYNRRLVCNYGSAGNVIGGDLYQIGTPASDCENGPGTVAGLCK